MKNVLGKLVLLIVLILVNIGLFAQGNALDFDGVDDFVYCGAPNMAISNNATVSAWIYPTALNGIIICQGFNHGGNENGWLFAIGDDNWGSPDPGELVWASHNATSNANEGMLVPSPNAVITLNKWQHVAATKNDTEVKLYLNGNLIHTESQSAANIVYNNGYDLHIGKQTTSEIYFNYRFPGKIDELQIWNVTLSENEIKSYMDSCLVGNESGLTAYYQFDEVDPATILPDITTNSNDGTLTSMDPATDWTESYAMVIPTLNTATNIAESSFDISWNEPLVGTVDNYYLEVATDSLFANRVTGYDPYKDIGINLTESVLGLLEATDYFIRVRAYKSSAGDVACYSLTKTIKTKDRKRYVQLLEYPLQANSVENNFNSIDMGNYSTPTFTDIDDDGLIDMIFGYMDVSMYGYLCHYEQNEPNSLSFSLINPNFNSINLGQYGYPSPSFTDLNNDGLLDMLLGKQNGTISHYQQDSLQSYTFTLITSNFNSINFGLYGNPNPSFTDIDNDGLIDMLIGEGAGNLNHYEQESENSTSFALRTNSFNNINVASSAAPTFTDLDNDGLLDMIIGEWDPNLSHYEQDAINSTSFSLKNQNFNSTSIGDGHSRPAVEDIDDDGLVDILVGEKLGNIHYFKQAVAETYDFGLVEINDNSQYEYYIKSVGLVEDIVINCPEGFLVSQNQSSGYVQTLNLTQVGGTASSIVYLRFQPDSVKNYNGSITHTSSGVSQKSIAVSGIGNGIPMISITGEPLSIDFESVILRNSLQNSYVLEAEYLRGDLSINCPTEFKISLTDSAGFIESLSITPLDGMILDTLYVQYSPQSIGSHGGNIVHTSENADTRNIAVTGQCILEPIIGSLLLPLEYDLKTNNFNSVNPLFEGNMDFFDIDGDQLLDLLVGDHSQDFKHYEQDSINSTSFSLKSSDFGGFSGGLTVKFTDLDNDGLVEFITGQNTGYCMRYEQNSPYSYDFTSLGTIRVGSTSIDVGDNAVPTITDIDNDGLYDMLIGEENGNINHYEQSSLNSSTFTLRSSNFNSIDVGNTSIPEFTDLEGDGLLDLLIGESEGNINHYIQNSLNSSSFTLVSEDYSFISSGAGTTTPNFADVDNDNAVDYFISDEINNIKHYEQKGVNSLDFDYVEIGDSLVNFYLLKASNLSNDIEINCTEDFRISFSQNSGFSQSLNAAPDNGAFCDTVFVNFNPDSIRYYSGVITHNTGSLNFMDIFVSGYGKEKVYPPKFALDFDGVDDHIDCGSQDLGINNNATVSAWIYPKALNGVIAVQGFNFGGNENGWVLSIGDIGWGTPDPGEIVWGSHDALTNGNEDMLVASSTSVITLNEWQHIAATKNGTEVKLYMNGDLVHTEDLASSEISYGNGYDVRIGSVSDFETTYFQNKFFGMIDELQIWNIALDQTDIQSNMQKDLTGYETDLAGYYNFDYESGSYLEDYCLNSNDGTLINMDDSDWVVSGAMIYTPTAISATLLTTSTFTSNWESNYTASRYYLDVATDSMFTAFVTGFENKEITDNTIVSDAVSGLTSMTEHYYRIRIYNEYTNQLSDNSNIVSVSTAVPNPQNISTTINGANLELSWDVVVGASTYKIYSSNDPYGTYTEDTSGTLIGKTWTIPYTESKKFYYVVAVDAKMPVTKKNIIIKTQEVR
ncbi:MAG: FG-GAP-like repeat-containing protein [Candidatus Delongbacteria bacterium]|nr:FG-GAP-like repeat-containing protein [Candidatus Delongbacteria bacterium]